MEKLTGKSGRVSARELNTQRAHKPARVLGMDAAHVPASLICALCALVCAIVVAAASVTAMPVAAFADDESDAANGAVVSENAGSPALLAANTTDDGWQYQVSGTEVTLTGYVGTSLTPAAPASIGGIPVTGVIVNAGAGAPQITSIDLTAVKGTLTQLKVYGCALSSLDLSDFTSLVKVDLRENALVMLNVSGCTSMEELLCSNNRLTALDVTSATALVKLDCAENYIDALTLQYCADLEYLDCHENRLTELKVGACTKLTDCFCYNNYISEDLSALVTRFGSENYVINPQYASEPSETVKTMTVYAGSDRYETANLIATSVADYGTRSGVIIASGVNGKFADALCASGLSGVLDYPIVLVNGGGTGLDSGTQTVLRNLLAGGSGDVVVLGGESTVSADIAAALLAYDNNGSVTRISGDDRYATAQEVYNYGANHGGWATDYAVLAIGNNFPDALGAASFCTSNKVPMLLTNQNSESLDSYVTNAAQAANEVLIVGGTASVSSAKEATLKNYATVERFGESTRYETNLAFANWQLSHGMFLENAGIATGTSFPDSLGSSYLLSITKSVLLLTAQDEATNANLYSLLKNNASSITKISVLGGSNSVSAATKDAIQSSIGGVWKTVNK